MTLLIALPQAVRAASVRAKASLGQALRLPGSRRAWQLQARAYDARDRGSRYGGRSPAPKVAFFCLKQSQLTVTACGPPALTAARRCCSRRLACPAWAPCGRARAPAWPPCGRARAPPGPALTRGSGPRRSCLGLPLLRGSGLAAKAAAGGATQELQGGGRQLRGAPGDGRPAPERWICSSVRIRVWRAHG